MGCQTRCHEQNYSRTQGSFGTNLQDLDVFFVTNQKVSHFLKFYRCKLSHRNHHPGTRVCTPVPRNQTIAFFRECLPPWLDAKRNPCVNAFRDIFETMESAFPKVSVPRKPLLQARPNPRLQPIPTLPREELHQPGMMNS